MKNPTNVPATLQTGVLFSAGGRRSEEVPARALCEITVDHLE